LIEKIFRVLVIYFYVLMLVMGVDVSFSLFVKARAKAGK
jgi:hypothetical protein